MVELEAATQKDGKTLFRWQKTVPARMVTLGRTPEQSEWSVPWDGQISKKHAELTWDGKNSRLRVQVLQQARNPAWYKGQKFLPGSEFWVSPADQFIIGDTAFRLVQISGDSTVAPFNPQLEEERTCNIQEIRGLRYADAEKRIEVLSKLPEMIRHSPSDEEFEDHIVNLLLQGVLRAHSAALVWIDPETATPTTEPKVIRMASRSGPDNFPISRHLVHSAVCRNRQTCLHGWGADPKSDSGLGGSLTRGSTQWGICSPLLNDSTPGWALYVAGVETDTPLRGGLTAKQMQDSDIKFVGTVAELVSSLRALRELEKKHAVLGRFFCPAVRRALADQNLEEVLKPRVTDVTVLCCDLRGSCGIAEAGDGGLEQACERVNAALELMTTRISEADGIISDFQGDATMCFWGWPHPQMGDAEKAAKAALNISQGFLRRSARDTDSLKGLACGIGLASGPGMAGRLGTADQFKIGVFGSTINLAARLESLTKLFRVHVLADDATAQRVKGKVRLRRLAMVQPYGMGKQVTIHEIMHDVNGDIKTISENQRFDYEAALERFISAKWETADRLLEKLPNDGPSLFLRKFMKDRDMRPPENWTGLIVLGQK